MINNKRRLTRNELVEYIRSNMPEQLTEIEQLAHIEKQVADSVVFNEAYSWSNKKTRKKIYELAKREAQKPKKEIRRKAICVDMAERFAYVARKFGFDVEFQIDDFMSEPQIGKNEIFYKISGDRGEHVCPIVRLKDGRMVQIDIQNDLKNLQTRSKTTSFGMKNNIWYLSELNQEEVKEAFRKAYGLADEEDFTDDYIDKLNKKMSSSYKPIEIIRMLMEDPRIQTEMQNTGCVEAKKYCQQILRQILGTPLSGTFYGKATYAHISTCSLLSSENNKRHSIFLYAEEKGIPEKLFYVFSKKTGKMVRLTPQELAQMRKQGMVIDPLFSKEPINNRVTEFITDAIHSFEVSTSNPIDRDTKSSIDVKDFFYDEDDLEP